MQLMFIFFLMDQETIYVLGITVVCIFARGEGVDYLCYRVPFWVSVEA